MVLRHLAAASHHQVFQVMAAKLARLLPQQRQHQLCWQRPALHCITMMLPQIMSWVM